MINLSNGCLRDAANGEVFAAGHAESGNDVPVLASTTKAERVEGGYRFTGRKHFGSLTPVWTRFGLHGMDLSDPGKPKVVHAFLPRDSAGFRIEETWDVLGMRATRSDDTILENTFVPDRYVARVVPAGAAGIDLFVLSIFAWALMGFGNIYYGLARRALDQSIAAVKSKKSVGLSRSMAYHAEVQHTIAEMVIELESIGPHLEKIAEDWSNGRGSRRAMADEDFCREIPGGGRLLARGGSGVRGRRRVRHLPVRGFRTNVSRRAVGPHPSSQFVSYA